ncbi:12569_t:CDS:2, partial [Gigaspora margarita]
MNSNSEYTSDINRPDNNEPCDTTKDSVEEQSPPSKRPRTSYVWKYFETEDKQDICKIIVTNKGDEDICGTSYKHD